MENKGIVSQYYVESSHEAIIPKKLYMMVQEKMVRKANLETGTGKRRIYSGKYALSSIVYCAHCGDVFQRTHWNVHGRKKIVWRCVSRLHKNLLRKVKRKLLFPTGFSFYLVLIFFVYTKKADFHQPIISCLSVLFYNALYTSLTRA